MKALALAMVLAVGPDLGSGQGVVLKDENVTQGMVSTINCSGAGVTCTRSGTTGTLSIAGGGGSSLTGVDPLYSDGGSVACLPAGTGDAGCVTESDQNFSGIKTFLDGVNVDGQGIHLTGPFSFLQQTDGRGLYFRDSLTGGGGSIDFYFQTLNTRTSGELFRVTNNTAASLILDYTNKLSINGETAQFACSGLASGRYCLIGSTGLYLAIGGQHPDNYWGHHGAVQASNLTKMIAGFPFEVYNPYSGTGAATDHIFMVGYRGSISTQSNLTSSTLMVCDGTDVNPPSDPSNRYGTTPPTGCTPAFESDGGYKTDAGLPDGGTGLCYDWYTATDAGHAQEGEIVLWVDDVGEACQCDATYYDGGLTSSWRRMSDRGECSAPAPPPVSGSSYFLETSQVLSGAGIYSFVITGQTWVTATSKINCTPFGTTADGLTPEVVAIAALGVSWSNPVVGTGFTLRVYNPHGLTGTVRFHCSGS